MLFCIICLSQYDTCTVCCYIMGYCDFLHKKFYLLKFSQQLFARCNFPLNIVFQLATLHRETSKLLRISLHTLTEMQIHWCSSGSETGNPLIMQIKLYYPQQMNCRTVPNQPLVLALFSLAELRCLCVLLTEERIHCKHSPGSIVLKENWFWLILCLSGKWQTYSTYRTAPNLKLRREQNIHPWGGFKVINSADGFTSKPRVQYRQML